jgi:hypothetical protein
MYPTMVLQVHVTLIWYDIKTYTTMVLQVHVTLIWYVLKTYPTMVLQVHVTLIWYALKTYPTMVLQVHVTIIEDQFSPNLINGDPCLRILQLGNMKISTRTTIKEYVVFVNET